MRKQKIIILLAAFVICLAGCGSKETETTQGPIEIDVLVNNDKRDAEENDSEDDTEIVPETPIKFDCFDEIKEASPDSGLVQIDDMILQYGSTGAELFEAINQSECEYTAEYNENQLVPAGEFEDIFFKKNGENYFRVSLKNFGAETIELKDCITDIISASKASKGNIYYAGANGETMTYNTVKEIMGNYEPEREFTRNDSMNNKRLAILYIIPDNKGIAQRDELYIYFIFDINTNELSSFWMCDYNGSTSSLPW